MSQNAHGLNPSLAADFRDSILRVQVLDEGEYGEQTWRDDVKALLEWDKVSFTLHNTGFEK